MEEESKEPLSTKERIEEMKNKLQAKKLAREKRAVEPDQPI